jgi:hypothetical protein
MTCWKNPVPYSPQEPAQMPRANVGYKIPNRSGEKIEDLLNLVSLSRGEMLPTADSKLCGAR